MVILNMLPIKKVIQPKTNIGSLWFFSVIDSNVDNDSRAYEVRLPELEIRWLHLFSSGVFICDAHSVVFLQPFLQEKLQLYFAKPQQLMVLLSKLTDQNLSLIQNSAGMDNMMEQTIEITIEKMWESHLSEG